MDKTIKTSRVVIMALLMALLLTVYILTLYRIEALDAGAILDEAENLTSATGVVRAARGSILDRNGVLLVSDREVHDVSIDRKTLLKETAPNDTVLKLINAARRFDVAYQDNFPVTSTAPFEFDAYASASQKVRMERYYEYFENTLSSYFDRDLDLEAENAGLTATELISWMRLHYGIPYSVPAEDARRIIGVRWELEIQAIVGTSEYIFARDVPDDFLGYVSEQHLPSVEIGTRSEREYHTPYAAHLLGAVGAMSREQYDSKYKDKGYPLDSQVGLTGAEEAFEEYLHGFEGSETVYRDSTGAIANVEETAPAIAGNNVFLSIDIDLQAATETALESSIVEINDERIEKAKAETPPNERYEEPELARGGAAVMMDVNTGEVLALASYPTYDLSSYYDNFAALSTDSVNAPLVNRALTGTYNPGSTFKMVSAYAALSSGTITPYTNIVCEGKFMEYADVNYTPSCWIWPNGTHGSLDVVGALENSCNFFFYTVADKMGITKIAETARLFGFGEHSGIEISDAVGRVASRELKRELLNEGWWAADTLISAIGQGLNEFTPIQMADYVSTIANGGVLYNATVLRSVSSFNYSDVIYRKEPSVRRVIEDEDGYIPILQQGMRAVATTGTAASALANYKIPVAAKTGTVQSDTSAINDGVFVCYAPADDPEIAIAVVVQKGGSGAALISIAQAMMDAYFSDSTYTAQSAYTEDSLLK